VSKNQELIYSKQFWNEISDFERNERKNESQNFLLAEARAGARMEAYVNLFYDRIFGKSKHIKKKQLSKKEYIPRWRSSDKFFKRII